jgi:hypothetical protein
MQNLTVHVRKALVKRIRDFPLVPNHMILNKLTLVYMYKTILLCS